MPALRRVTGTNRRIEATFAFSRVSAFASGRLDGLVVTLKCSHCGAPLKATPEQTVVTCGYCETATRIASTREHRRTEARSRGAPQSRIFALAVVGVLSTAAIAAVVVKSRSRAVTPSSDRGPESAQATPTRPVAEQAMAAASQGDGMQPDTKQGPDVAATVSPAAPARGTRRKGAGNAAPTGPVSTKKEAEEVLRPELLACMKQHGVHYLITRLGNNPRGANVPPLGLTGTSIVDYKPTPRFAATPLGRCVARAASGVRAPAYGGNYIYFGLRAESIPDPLADAPARLDTAAAKQALAALDDEARDCTTRSPSGSRPGESVSVMVSFEGATGKVSKVEPYYVDIRSAYGRCLSSVYRKAIVAKFREIDHDVLHVLAP